MFVIEIKDKPFSWVAAVHSQENKAKAILEKLPSEKKEMATVLSIPHSEFPIYIVEKYILDLGDDKLNVFEYCSEKELLNLVENQVQDVRDYFEAYFTFYIIEENYIQKVLNKSYMGTLDHTHVDNYFLKNKSIKEEIKPRTISQLSNDWSFERLDALFEKYIKEGTEEQKNELAEEGYLSLLGTMTYDYACGKLTELGVEMMLPMVEKAEKLLGEKLHYQKGYIYSIQLDQAIKQEKDDLLPLLYASESEFQKHIKIDPSEAQETYEELGKIYSQAAGAVLEQRQAFWEKSIHYVKKSIIENPAKATWNLYLELLYIPYDGRKFQNTSTLELNKGKLEHEINEFKQLVEQLEPTTPILSVSIAIAHKHLLEMLEWHKMPASIFPVSDYLYWLKKSIDWDGTGTNRMQLLEVAHLFHNEGKRLHRIDLLKTAAKHYQRMIDHVENPAFEVYYLASVLEDIAKIYTENEEFEKAETKMNNISFIYNSHLDLVKSNFSTFSHYSDFLERCFNYAGNISKPTFEEFYKVALQNEENSEGMYSSPIFMLARMALFKKNEEEAIYYLSKTLILHELCIEDEFLNFKSATKDLSFEKLNSFLENTINYLNELRKKEDYYYDPKIKWEDLKKMSQKDVIKAWSDICK